MNIKRNILSCYVHRVCERERRYKGSISGAPIADYLDHKHKHIHLYIILPNKVLKCDNWLGPAAF